MIYTQQDFMMLERLTDQELVQARDLAKDVYDYVQEQISENSSNPFQGYVMPLDVAISHLKNIESYIRKIENLLNEYEADRTFVRQAISRRKKRLLNRVFIVTDEN